MKREIQAVESGEDFIINVNIHRVWILYMTVFPVLFLLQALYELCKIVLHNIIMTLESWTLCFQKLDITLMLSSRAQLFRWIALNLLDKSISFGFCNTYLLHRDSSSGQCYLMFEQPGLDNRVDKMLARGSNNLCYPPCR